MSGNLAGYLSKLTNQTVSDGMTIAVTSSQKAALFAWLKHEGVEFNKAALDSGRFTIESLLGRDAGQAERAPTIMTAASLNTSGNVDHAANLGFALGIDIEDAKQLPDAMDYREHEFYQENFTAAEISHCIQRPDPKLSFCGLWAAKEAIAKATGLFPSNPALRSIEIKHDSTGRPMFAGVQLSITHANHLCIAVCAVPQPRQGGNVTASLADSGQPAQSQHNHRFCYFSVILIVLLATAVLFFLIRDWAEILSSIRQLFR